MLCAGVGELDADRIGEPLRILALWKSDSGADSLDTVDGRGGIHRHTPLVRRLGTGGLGENGQAPRKNRRNEKNRGFHGGLLQRCGQPLSSMWGNVWAGPRIPATRV